jgi:hypothetical protein
LRKLAILIQDVERPRCALRPLSQTQRSRAIIPRTTTTQKPSNQRQHPTLPQQCVCEHDNLLWARAKLHSVATLPFAPGVLWTNAGFGSLRTCEELEGVDARCDPTVIPLVQPGDETPARYTDVTSLSRAPPKDGQPRFHTIEDFHNAYESGAITPSDVVESLLPLIRRDVERRNPLSTSFTETQVELVRRAAEASTQRWKAGKPLGILDGVPFAVKDDLDVEGYKTHRGTSRDYTEGRSVETSWCVRKCEEEGAVLIGKLNMHELGSGKLSCYRLLWPIADHHRHHEQQPCLGHALEPIQPLVLHRRLLWRCRISRGPRNRSVRHRFRRWRIDQDTLQLHRPIRSQALSRASVEVPHDRRKLCHRPWTPSLKHGRPRAIVPRSRSTQSVQLALFAFQPTEAAPWLTR